MHLLQPERITRTGNPLTQPRTICRHRLRIVAYMLAQIEAGIRTDTDSAFPCCQQTAHIQRVARQYFTRENRMVGFITKKGADLK